MKVSRDEMETIITRTAAEQDWHVFSEDPRVIRKMTKLHGEGTKSGSLGMEWTVLKACISFRRPIVLTEEQRAARSARASSLRPRNTSINVPQEDNPS